MSATRHEGPSKIRFFRRWIIAVTLGETLGFTIAAVVGGTLASASAPAALAYPVMIAAGAVEGACLGAGQAAGFGKPAPVRLTTWIVATAFGAAAAWAIGLLPSTITGFTLDNSLAVVLTALGAITLLASIPVLQWVVLRRSIRPASLWIPANMAGWAVGILWTLAPSPFIDEFTPFSAILATFAIAGMLMAVTVATVTGIAAWRVVRSARQIKGGLHDPATPATER